MAMDIVIRENHGLVVADAKYYRAQGIGTAPGWADMAVFGNDDTYLWVLRAL